MLKKIVSLVVGATLVLATLGVSAATVSTVSEYDATKANIIVTTTVKDTAADDVYTYLAYKKGASVENLANADVVYVDEKAPTAAGEDVVFSYSTLAANNEAVVLIGGAAEKPVEDKIDAPDPIVYKDVVVNGVAVKVEIPNGVVDSDFVLVPKADLSEVVISGVTLNGVAFDGYYAAADGLYVPYSAIKGEGEYSFVIETMQGAEKYSVDLWNGAYIPASGDKPEAVIAVAKIWGSAEKFGIKFAGNEEFTNSFDAEAKGVGTNGLFAIRLNDINHENSQLKGATTVFAKAFAGLDEESTVYSDVYEINIGVSVEDPAEDPAEV